MLATNPLKSAVNLHQNDHTNTSRAKHIQTYPALKAAVSMHSQLEHDARPKKLQQQLRA